MTTTFPRLDEVKGQLADRRKKLAEVFDEAGPTLDMSLVKCVQGDTAAKVEQIRAWNAEMDDLEVKRSELQAVWDIANGVKADRERNRRPDAEAGADGDRPKPGHADVKESFGALFTKSKAFTGRVRGGQGAVDEIDVDLKTLMTTTAGWAPETFRTGRLVEFATRPIQVTDLIPGNTTVQNAVVYMEETTFTNSAAEAAEDGTYAESALALTEQTSPVRKIATFIPVTDEQLEDVAMVQGYIDNRLRFMVAQRLDGQILTGNGTAPNLRGLLNVVGISTQAKGADPTPDAAYKAMVKIMVTGRAMPDGFVFHPTNWQDVRLLRTADGIYIWGSPADPGPNRLWGLPVAMSDGITLGTALAADFGNYTELVTRRGIDVQISNSHSTFFIEGKQAVRADVRVALVAYRPAAICTITGL